MSDILAEVQFVDNGRFFSTNLTEQEYMNLLQTGGILDGKQLVSIKLFDFPNSDNKGLVFDFSLAKRGAMPWRMQELNI